MLEDISYNKLLWMINCKRKMKRRSRKRIYCGGVLFFLIVGLGVIFIGVVVVKCNNVRIWVCYCKWYNDMVVSIWVEDGVYGDRDLVIVYIYISYYKLFRLRG